MCLCVYFCVDLLNFPVLANDDRLACARREAQSRGQFVFGIGKQRVVEVVGGLEASQCGRIVAGSAEEDVTFFDKFGDFVTETAGLGNSPSRKGLGEEEDDHPEFVFELIQCHHCA